MGWGGIITSAESTSLVGASSGPPPPQKKNFKFGGSKTLFSALVTRYVSEKNHLEYENGKQLQVTITKIESKGNKSIHRLDLSGSTGPGDQGPPASYSSET